MRNFAFDEAERLRKINMEKLEAEKVHQTQVHDERERALLAQLAKLDREEEERRRNRKPETTTIQSIP